MVFSWAIARSAGLTGTSEVEAVLSRAVSRKENGLGLTLETESEPSLRLLVLLSGGPLSFYFWILSRLSM
jgi:hypothetical protein